MSFVALSTVASWVLVLVGYLAAERLIARYRYRRRAEEDLRARLAAAEDAKWKVFLSLVSDRLECEPPDYASATMIARVAAAYYAREALRQSGKLN